MTSTLYDTPDRDDDGTVVLFRTRATESVLTDADTVQADAVRADLTDDEPGEVADAELTDEDQPVSMLVDQADTALPENDRPLPDRLAELTEARRPILPAWLQHQAELTAVLKWAATHTGHVAAYHAVRCPLYVGRLALRAPRGLLRVVAQVVSWAFDFEGLRCVRTRWPRATGTDTCASWKLAGNVFGIG
jgi:S-DNA-T family DNA segregation ATPase FtsK/SpoIIIE